MGASRSRAGDGTGSNVPEDDDSVDLVTPAERGEAQAIDPLPTIGVIEPEEQAESAGPKAGHVLVRIAARRSLRVPIVTGKRFEGETLVDVLGSRTAHAGEVVEVREDEVADLRTLGFVEHGGAQPPPVLVADASILGPTVNGRPSGVFNIDPAG